MMMHDDTDTSLGSISSSPEDVRNAMVSISEHHTTESDSEGSYTWSQHLRFITPIIDRLPPRVERELQLGTRDRGLIPSRKGKIPKSEDEFDAAASSEETCTCDYFDHRRFYGDEQSLRLTASASLPICTHYVAVSYCWAISGNAAYDGRAYTITDQDGEKPAKAPPFVLQRAVAFASFHHIPFIWIDQECIRQDDAKDVQVGTQVMKVVYAQAAATVAVLGAVLNEQRQLDALAAFLESEDMADAELLHLVEAFEIILADPWFTRAWTLQEYVCGTPRVTLLLSCKDGLAIPWNSSFDSFEGRIIGVDTSQLHELVAQWTVLLDEAETKGRRFAINQGNVPPARRPMVQRHHTHYAIPWRY